VPAAAAQFSAELAQAGETGFGCPGGPGEVIKVVVEGPQRGLPEVGPGPVASAALGGQAAQVQGRAGHDDGVAPGQSPGDLRLVGPHRAGRVGGEVEDGHGGMVA